MLSLQDNPIWITSSKEDDLIVLFLLDSLDIRIPVFGINGQVPYIVCNYPQFVSEEVYLPSRVDRQYEEDVCN